MKKLLSVFKLVTKSKPVEVSVRPNVNTHAMFQAMQAGNDLQDLYRY